jgi:hypothetical protein
MNDAAAVDEQAHRVQASPGPTLIAISPVIYSISPSNLPCRSVASGTHTASDLHRCGRSAARVAGSIPPSSTTTRPDQLRAGLAVSPVLPAKCARKSATRGCTGVGTVPTRGPRTRCGRRASESASVGFALFSAHHRTCAVPGASARCDPGPSLLAAALHRPDRPSVPALHPYDRRPWTTSAPSSSSRWA